MWTEIPPPPPRPLVLVTGATGRQGGAVARRLLDRGHRVRALTRSPGSLAARQLERLGAELAAGDFDDFTSLVEAMQGVDAVFAMSTADGGPRAEIRQGRALVDAAHVARVEHLIHSSIANANTRVGVVHFEAKYAIETYLRSSAVPATVIGPVLFMESLRTSAALAALRSGALTLAMPPDRNLDLIALEDLASFVLMVIERRRNFVGVRIDIASDSITGPTAADALTRMLGRSINYNVDTPVAQSAPVAGEDARLFRWVNEVGFRVSTRTLHATYPNIGWHSFDLWTQYQDWSSVPAPRPRKPDDPDASFADLGQPHCGRASR